MDFFPKNIQFINGAFWLIKLRWMAIGWLLCITLAARFIFNLEIQDTVFYLVTCALVLENLLCLMILKPFTRKNTNRFTKYIVWVINFQITVDFIGLTVLTHYSGGIENPIFFFFIFHMVISAVMLSRRASYFQTTFALVLLWALAYFEYSGILDHHELWLKRKAGNELYLDKTYLIEILTVFSLSAYLLVYMANYIVGLLRKQEKAYHRANIMLRRQDRIKDEYILHITHNIKGHLAAIQMNLAIIADETMNKTADVQKELTTATHERVVNLTRFINDLLKLTHMRLDDQVETETFSLPGLIDKILPSIRCNAEARSIVFRYYADDTIHDITNCAVAIEEMLINLLSNAINYTPRNGVVELIVKKSDMKIIFEISDTGIGIPEKDLSNIFNEFFRCSNAKKYIKDGTGLGLAMVNHIVQQCGGEIYVASKEGKGSKFTVIFPEKVTFVEQKGAISQQ